MKSRQYFIIQIVVIVVLVIFGILEVKRVTDRQIRHSRILKSVRIDSTAVPPSQEINERQEKGSRTRVELLGGLKTVNLGRIEVRPVKQYTDAMISRAIWYAEGGFKAKYLYGIRSVKYSSPEKARLACLQSVRNGRERWIKAGCPGDFIMFLGEKYCPPADHPLNIHWVGNVYKYLERANGK